ncbi:MAG TPA: 50S ribosomal protein L21, partial [Phototrophicaceae bacterium]|nr:50S ribosomal protein L21 [Phototrophicaceae bacterium]
LMLIKLLLIGNDASTLIGQPLVEGATVKATVVKQFRGPKIIVFRYHQRRTHKRKTGHRQYYTRLRIDEIVVP